MSHTCHAEGCSKRVPPKMFACRAHWFALPLKVRNAIWREYRAGQEVDKKPSVSYLAVQQYAVGLLAEREEIDGSEAFANARRFEARAIAAGEESPLRGFRRYWEET